MVEKGWQRIDLAGGGVQSANLALARRLKRRGRAYALLALFPLGLHRAYLEEPRGAWGLRALALLAAAAWLAGRPLLAAVPAAAAALWALHDLRWIEGRIAAVNKRLRMEVYLAPREGPPAGWRGRYSDDEAAGAAGPRRAPSFAEQEALLRELAKRKDRPPG